VMGGPECSGVESGAPASTAQALNSRSDRPRSRRLTDGQVNRDAWPRAESPGSSLRRSLNLLLVAGAAYFAWEHEQGRHAQPHVLCPLCWLNKIAPAPEASGGSSPAEPPEQA
jgi:hypothetical protein